MEESLIMSIAKLSPVFAVLALWLWQTLKRLTEREKEITTLQESIRSTEKDNMKLFSQVSETLINITNDTENSNETVVREIKELREFVKERLK